MSKLRIAVSFIDDSGKNIGEIAANVFDIPSNWPYIERVTADIVGRTRNGGRVLILKAVKFNFSDIGLHGLTDDL